MRMSLLLKREKTAETALPGYKAHVSSEIISLDTSKLLCVYEVSGIAFETVDQADLDALNRKLILLWQNVSDERVSLTTHLFRTHDQIANAGKFWTDFSKKLNDDYLCRLSAQDLFSNKLYLTIIFNPDVTQLSKLSTLLKGKAAAVFQDQADNIRNFENIRQMVSALLEAYSPRPLAIIEKKGLFFSEIMSFLEKIGSLEERPMPLVNGPIAGALMIDRPIFGKETIELRGAGSSKYFGLFGIKELSTRTHPGQLSGLLKAPFEFVLTQSFVFWARNRASSVLATRQRQLLNTNSKGATLIDDLDDALDNLASGRIIFGDYNFSLMVAGDTTKKLLNNMSTATRLLVDAGLNVSREELSLIAAYLAQFPGNFSYMPRSAGFSGENFADLSTFYSYPSGRKHNIWGDAVAAFKTSAATLYNFNLHVSDVGSTFICGPSGSGKTVLQNFILSQLQKLNATLVFFDKDRGAYIFVVASGGTYLSLKNAVPTGLAPFKQLDFSNHQDFAFLSSFLRKLVEIPEKQLSASEQRQLDEALIHFGELEPAHRSFANLISFLDATDLDGIGARLSRWQQGQALGWVFDNSEDRLVLDAQFLGFDMTEFLDNPEIRTPIMMYLFHRIEKLIDGTRRIVIDIDEFWKALGDSYFSNLIRDKLKTIRKQNGLLIFGTQEPGDVLASEIGRTVVSQTPTLIFMPNSRADYRDYVEGFKLTTREFEIIKDEISPESRQFLIKQGHQSVVAELNLNGFSEALIVLSGRTAANNALDEIITTHKSLPDNWLELLTQSVELRNEI